MAFPRGETGELPVGIGDALEAVVAVLSLDQARWAGQVIDLTPVWAELNNFRLRK